MRVRSFYSDLWAYDLRPEGDWWVGKKEMVVQEFVDRCWHCQGSGMSRCSCTKFMMRSDYQHNIEMQQSREVHHHHHHHGIGHSGMMHGGMGRTNFGYAGNMGPGMGMGYGGPTAYSMGGKPDCMFCHGSGLQRCKKCHAHGTLKLVTFTKRCSFKFLFTWYDPQIC